MTIYTKLLCNISVIYSYSLLRFVSVSFRFCPEKYYPFDPEKILKYVVTDDYLPIWKVEELETLYVRLDYNKKHTLLTQIKQQGKC